MTDCEIKYRRDLSDSELLLWWDTFAEYPTTDRTQRRRVNELLNERKAGDPWSHWIKRNPEDRDRRYRMGQSARTTARWAKWRKDQAAAHAA